MENDPDEKKVKIEEEEEETPELYDVDSDEEEDDEDVTEAPLGSVFEPNWSHWYSKCPTWKNTLEETQNVEVDWPQGIQILDGRMFLD